MLRYHLTTIKYAKIQILVTGCVGEDLEKEALSKMIRVYIIGYYYWGQFGNIYQNNKRIYP